MNPKYRLFKHVEEATDHLKSVCFALTSNEFLNSHNSLGQYLHWKIIYRKAPHRKVVWVKLLPVLGGDGDTSFWAFTIPTRLYKITDIYRR